MCEGGDRTFVVSGGFPPISKDKSCEKRISWTVFRAHRYILRKVARLFHLLPDSRPRNTIADAAADPRNISREMQSVAQVNWRE